MQDIYNTIVDRKLDTGTLPIGARVRITMLAQLVVRGLRPLFNILLIKHDVIGASR